nr:proteinase inhibitor PSI-1.2-like [Ipomoea batatas]GME19023.1 proteinase inhibitor PSI-1.2-like [Ipomoea batatas]
MGAISKVWLLTMLLCGIIMVGSKVEAKQVCIQQCMEVAYTKCPPNFKKIRPSCVNCCTVKKGCKLYRASGSLICTGK